MWIFLNKTMVWWPICTYYKLSISVNTIMLSERPRRQTSTVSLLVIHSKVLLLESIKLKISMLAAVLYRFLHKLVPEFQGHQTLGCTRCMCTPYNLGGLGMYAVQKVIHRGNKIFEFLFLWENFFSIEVFRFWKNCRIKMQ